MFDMHVLLNELDILTDDRNPKSIFQANKRRILKEHEANYKEFLAKTAKSMEVKKFRAEGKPVAESEHLARTSERYMEAKQEHFTEALEAEKAKAIHNQKHMKGTR